MIHEEHKLRALAAAIEKVLEEELGQKPMFVLLVTTETSPTAQYASNVELKRGLCMIDALLEWMHNRTAQMVTVPRRGGEH